MSKILIAMALESESQGLLETTGIPILYTGVGKINATYALTRRLAEYACAGVPMPHVVNFGSAGSRTLSRGSVVACRRFVQRDMDVTALGFGLGVTPFDDTPSVLEFPVTTQELPLYTCSSGDSFETGTSLSGAADVIDMEAYALAKVCWAFEAPFSCVKFITDGANETASTDWIENVPAAAVHFERLCRAFFGGDACTRA